MADNYFETVEAPQIVDTTQAACHACPHLGHYNDLHLYSCYPSGRNSCFRSGKAESISREQQGTYCLSDGHVRCPIFQQRTAKTTSKQTVNLGKLIFGFLSGH